MNGFLSSTIVHVHIKIYRCLNISVRLRFCVWLRVKAIDIIVFIFLDPAFNLNQNNILSFLNNINSSNTLNKLQNELKTLKTEVNSRRKDISTLAINEEGLRKNIKYLEEIISLKVSSNNSFFNSYILIFVFLS